MSVQAAASLGIGMLSQAKALYGRLTPESTLAARRLLETALDDPAAGLAASLDRPVLAESWALLADILTCDYLNRWNGADAGHIAQAEAAVEAALRLDPALPLAHYARGFILRAQGRHEQALAAYARTIELNPDFIRAYAHQAAELLYLGRLDEVPPLVLIAIDRTPAGNLALGMFYWILGRCHFFAARYKEAISWLRRSVEVRPNLWYNRLYLVSAYALIGQHDDAQRTLGEFNTLFPDYTVARVRRDEQTNPNRHPVVVEGRKRFHQGLLAAGMSEG